MTMEAQVHSYADSSGSDCEERLSDFDEEFYKYRPPALIVQPDQKVIVEPEPDQIKQKGMDIVDSRIPTPLRNVKTNSCLDCIINCLTCCF